MQAPKGELKENTLGCNSSYDISHLGHEKNSLYKCSFLPISLIITSPDPTFKANSIELVRRSFILFFKTNLSIITSMVCFIFLANLIH